MSDLCNEVERFGKGIGSVPRYRIVEALFSGTKSVGELATLTKLSQSLVSQHLRVLKEAEIVVPVKNGQSVYYSLNTEYTIRLLKNLTEELRTSKK